MPVYSFPCPHCSTRLRLKDRRLVGRTIACPDCGQAVELQHDAHSGIVGYAAVRAGENRPSTRFSELGTTARRWIARATSPIAAAWIVAGMLSAGLLGWLLASPATDDAQLAAESHAVAADGELVKADPAGIEQADRIDADEEPVEGRLRGLFDGLAAHRARTGVWPRGTAGNPSLPEEQRFSWLAALAAHAAPTGPQPHWDRPWNDPLNDRFVRQRQDAFLNPAVKQQAGQDRYPASHFVGVTGVGADSQWLGDDHPRAGIFGRDRSTSPEDVTDGLANTMLVAGVDRQLGSWAAGGRSTIRGFTQEPYINGPDGFGTGQDDGMFVLMADGSVRFLSAKTDPVIVRRMAAKADGLPLDPSITEPERMAQQEKPVPDDPSVETPIEESAADEANPFEIADVVAELAKGADRPIEVPLAAEEVAADAEERIDISAALQQPIARFDQQAPVPTLRLLRSIEEMAAVRMELDQLPDHIRERLNKPVTVSLSNTTVGDLLTAVLKQVDLRYDIQHDHLSISERPSGQ